MHGNRYFKYMINLGKLISLTLLDHFLLIL